MGLLALLFWRPWNITWPVIWGERWGLGLLFIAIAMTWKIPWKSKIFPAALTYLWISVTASGFLMEFHPNIRGLSELTLGLKAASIAPFAIGLGFLCFLHLGFSLRRQLWWTSVGILAAIAVSPAPRNMVYLMDNPTMAAVTVVLASGLSLPMSLAAMLLTHSYTALAALGAGLCWRYRRNWLVPVGFLLIILALIYYARVTGRTPDNGRFAMWREYVRFWWAWDWPRDWFQLQVPPIRRFLVHWFGFGFGTSWVYFPLMRVATTATNFAMVSNWLHNDFLQVLPELGIIGELFLLACAGRLFSLANSHQKARLLALYAAMFFNFPLHWLVSALVGWDLIREVGIKNAIQESSPAPKIRGAREVWKNVQESLRRVREGDSLSAQVARESEARTRKRDR